MPHFMAVWPISPPVWWQPGDLFPKGEGSQSIERSSTAYMLSC